MMYDLSYNCGNRLLAQYHHNFHKYDKQYNTVLV